MEVFEQEILGLRDTAALVGLTGEQGVSGTVYEFKIYSESPNYSVDDMTSDTGTDGEIWTNILTQD